MDRHYAAFISYRHLPLDMAVATALHRRIEHYIVPKPYRKDGQKRMGLVFRDRDELPLSSDLGSDILRALDNSRFLIVVCTPETQKSAWCTKEIEYFVSRHGRERVLIVLADGTPEESIPPRLLNRYADDGETVIGHMEPLCANLVAGSTHPKIRQLAALNKLNEEFLRLAAAMLGCAFDDLRQRRKRRNRRILTAASAAALTIMATLTAQNITIRQQNLDIIAKNAEITEKNLEITGKNQEIARQLQQTQRKESEALSMISEDALAEGDRFGALESALAALPAEPEERPYYAPAEHALTSALYIYQDVGLRFAARIQQDNDIIAMSVSEDGRLAVTLDMESNVRCFDLTRQELLWSHRLREGYSDPVAASAYANSLHILEEANGVLCVADWTNTLLSLEDGSVILREEGTGASYFTTALLSPADNWLATLWQDWVYFYDAATQKTLYYTVESDGEKIWTVSPGSGCFSPEGRYFASVYHFAEEETGEAGYVVSIADLEGRSLVDCPFYAGEVTDPHIIALPDGNWLIAYTQNGTVNLHCLTGELDTVYERQLDAKVPESTSLGNHPADVYHGTNSRRFVAGLAGENFACFVYNNYLLAVNSADGSVLQKTTLESDCLWAGLRDSRLMYVLSGGSIWAAGPDGEETELLLECGFPIYQVWSTGPDGSGFCVIPEQSPSSAVGLQQLGDERAMVLFAPESETVTECTVCRDGAGTRLLVSVKGGSSGRQTVIFDAGTLQVLAEPEVSRYREIQGFSSDGNRILQGSNYYDLSAGELGQLQWPDGEISCFTHIKSVHLSEQQPGEPVLTVGLSGDTLCWWLDADDPQYSRCPYGVEAFAWPDPYWDPLEVGQNGLIAMQYSEEYDPSMQEVACATTAFVIFSTEDGTWHWLDNPSDATISSRICLGTREKWMAIVDEYGVLRIYDQKQDAVIREFSLGIIAAAVDQLNFLQGDKTLLITQTNGCITAVDTATGEVQNTFWIEDYDRNCSLVFLEDKAAGRVFVCETGGGITGMYIETETWSILAEIPKLACYLPGEGRLIQVDPDSGLVTVRNIYSMEELIAMGRELLSRIAK